MAVCDIGNYGHPMKKTAFLLLACALFVADTAMMKAQGKESKYKLVFAEEFNQRNGSLPNSDKWSVSKRYWSTWNRWIAKGKDVTRIKNGSLVCRAVPNGDMKADTALMLTGALETKDKFSFTYGKVEVRMKTGRHKGNFPAVWLMPQPPAPNHPLGGEIDIVECKDAENKAYHTVHSNWTLNLKKTNSPKHNFETSLDVTKWHVYGLEWTTDKLLWTVDGKTVGVYMKSTDKEALANGQWPFDRPFYIIVNQSVGSGRWADNPDLKHTYETRIDWIRVYQRE